MPGDYLQMFSNWVGKKTLSYGVCPQCNGSTNKVHQCIGTSLNGRDRAGLKDKAPKEVKKFLIFAKL